MEELRLLDNHLGPLDSHSRPDTSVDPAFRSLPHQSLHNSARTLVSRCRPSPAFHGGEAELSHLPRKPSCVFALVSDPGPASTPCQ